MRPTRRRIAVVTGSRAEYGLWRSTLEAIAKNPALQLQLVVTGTHLLKKFGRTIQEIESDGWPIAARVPMQRGDDGRLDQAEGLARGVAGMARFLDRAKSDIVVVLGDRIEAMAGALAGVTTGRVVAHVHGGDIAPGDFDDNLRHAITKLSHLHLTATKSAGERILRMGEQPERVCWVGAPGLDRLAELRRLKCEVRSEKGKRALIVQHPCGRSAEEERRVMEMILRAVDEAGWSATCVYPNSDRGHSGIVRAITAHRRLARRGSFRVVRSLPRDEYLRLLIEADVLIGNSSSGIIESATAGTPAVNVGSRQLGREEGGATVIHAEETVPTIRRGLRRALRMRPITVRSSPYGDGTAGRRIAAILALVPLHASFRRKVFADARGVRGPSRR